MVNRESVLQAVGPARVLGDVPADRAHLLARRVRRVEEARVRDRPGHVEVRDSRLDDDALALEVDLENPVHASEGDDDSSGDRCSPAGEPRSRASGDERDALPVTGTYDCLDLLGRVREDDELRDRAVSGQPVAFVDPQLLRLGDDVPGAYRPLKLGEQRLVHGAQNASKASGSLGSARTSCTSPSAMRKRRTWSSASSRPPRRPRAR